MPYLSPAPRFALAGAIALPVGHRRGDRRFHLSGAAVHARGRREPAPLPQLHAGPRLRHGRDGAAGDVTENAEVVFSAEGQDVLACPTWIGGKDWESVCRSSGSPVDPVFIGEKAI